jgi:hypothetical protein
MIVEFENYRIQYNTVIQDADEWLFRQRDSNYRNTFPVNYQTYRYIVWDNA